MKRCTKCGVTKSLEDFASDGHRTDGRQSWCRECHRRHRAERRQNDSVNDRIYMRARGRALQRLKERHPDEFARYLDEELAKEWSAYRAQFVKKNAPAAVVSGDDRGGAPKPAA